MLHKALFAIPIAMLLLMPLAGAASPLTGISLASSLGIAAIAILFSLSLVGLSYMLGEMLRIESLKRWYRGELWETAKSALIVVSIFAVLVIVGGIADSLAGNAANFSFSGNIITASNQIQSNLLGLANTANAYLSSETTTIQDSFNMLYGLSYGVDFIKSLSISLWIPIPIPIPFPEIYAGFMFGSSSSIYTSSVIATIPAGSQSVLTDYTTVIMLPLLIVFTIQQQYLLVIMSMGLALFLPIGVILRAMPVLRPLGGTFIAIGIGLAIIYPALLVAFNLPITSFTNGIFGLTTTSCGAPQLPGPVLGRFGPVLNYYGSSINNPSGPGGSCLSFGGGFDVGASAIEGVYKPINLISYTLVDALIQFILLIFDLVLALVITGDIARLLGGRLPTGIGKFKIA